MFQSTQREGERGIDDDILRKLFLPFQPSLNFQNLSAQFYIDLRWIASLRNHMLLERARKWEYQSWIKNSLA